MVSARRREFPVFGMNLKKWLNHKKVKYWQSSQPNRLGNDGRTNQPVPRGRLQAAPRLKTHTM